VVPVWPGQYLVHVFTPYFFPSRVGPADITVGVHPGQLIELQYRAPLWTFSRGSLGSLPQRYNGLIAMLVVIAVAVLVVFVASAVPILAG
jgi:hypothetical protein